jgi:hypothetical protein
MLLLYLLSQLRLDATANLERVQVPDVQYPFVLLWGPGVRPIGAPIHGRVSDISRPVSLAQMNISPGSL